MYFDMTFDRTVGKFVPPAVLSTIESCFAANSKRAFLSRFSTRLPVGPDATHAQEAEFYRRSICIDLALTAFRVALKDPDQLVVLPESEHQALVMPNAELGREQFWYRTFPGVYVLAQAYFKNLRTKVSTKALVWTPSALERLRQSVESALLFIDVLYASSPDSLITRWQAGLQNFDAYRLPTPPELPPNHEQSIFEISWLAKGLPYRICYEATDWEPTSTK